MPRADAQSLVDAVLGESLDKIVAEEHEALAAWAETVIEQALSSGPEDGPALVPGGPTASALAQSSGGNRANKAEVLVFMSLSVPEPSWRQWSREAARIGAPMVLRGVAEGGLTATVNRIAARHAEDGAGAGIDPRLFRLFRIGSVPAVAVIPGGVPACTTPGCSSDPPPPHDLVTGNIGLDGALEAIVTGRRPGSGNGHQAIGRAERRNALKNRLRTRRPRDVSWALLLACWLLGGLAVAQEQNQAAKAAAQAVGSVGQAAARAVARDASQPLNVPGFEGTDLAEADHTATGMDAAARRALADPNDAGWCGGPCGGRRDAVASGCLPVRDRSGNPARRHRTKHAKRSGVAGR